MAFQAPLAQRQVTSNFYYCNPMGRLVVAWTSNFSLNDNEKCVKLIKFKINYRYLTTLVVFALGVILINFLSKDIIHFYWTINFALMVIFSLILATALMLLSIKGFIRLIKAEQ